MSTRKGDGDDDYTGQVPSIIVDGTDRTWVNDPHGSSEGQQLPSGEFEIAIVGRPPAGTPNEASVWRILVDATSATRSRPSLLPGVDGQGEDAILVS
jgi:hypothetical protein